MKQNMPQIITKYLMRPRQTTEAVWTSGMTALVLAALIIAFFASLIDEWSITFIRRLATPIVAAFEAITDIALARLYLYPAMLVVLVVGLVLWLTRRNRRVRPARRYLQIIFNQALFIAVAILLVRWIVDFLKITFGRERPELMQPDHAYDFDLFEFDNLHWSFPSGHAATAGVITVILILWVPRARLAALLFGGILAIARVVIEKHYPSDVVVGFAIGALVTLFLARWLAAHALIFRHSAGKLIPVMHWPRNVRPNARPDTRPNIRPNISPNISEGPEADCARSGSVNKA